MHLCFALHMKTLHPRSWRLSALAIVCTLWSFQTPPNPTCTRAQTCHPRSPTRIWSGRPTPRRGAISDCWPCASRTCWSRSVWMWCKCSSSLLKLAAASAWMGMDSPTHHAMGSSGIGGSQMASDGRHVPSQIVHRHGVPMTLVCTALKLDKFVLCRSCVLESCPIIVLCVSAVQSCTHVSVQLLDVLSLSRWAYTCLCAPACVMQRLFDSDLCNQGVLPDGMHFSVQSWV
mmetsp:Transcript_16426/g.28147  ORF Transcript_16426/g.28147 Transcript_16426/m.28147 type:complete len:231 (-) Transcript_16426:12-704(-)